MAEIIRYPMASHGALLSALVRGASWTQTSDIAEALDAHATHDENRLAMAEHHGLLNALSGMAQLTAGGTEADQIREAAVRAIEKLANDDVAIPVLSKNEDIVLALSQATFSHNENHESPFHVALKNVVATL